MIFNLVQSIDVIVRYLFVDAVVVCKLIKLHGQCDLNDMDKLVASI